MNIQNVFISRGCTDKQDCFVVSQGYALSDQEISHRFTNDQPYIIYASGNDVVVCNSKVSIPLIIFSQFTFLD